VSVNRERGESAEESARNGTAGTSDRVRRVHGMSLRRADARTHARATASRSHACCRQNDDARGRLLPIEVTRVDVTWGSWPIAACSLGGRDLEHEELDANAASVVRLMAPRSKIQQPRDSR
jgi:hypothetical protein